MRIRHIALAMGVAAIAAGLVLGTAVGHDKGGPTPKTWTTVFKSPIAIEGLTLDHRGNLYVPQRGGAAGCSIVKISSTGGADQTGVVVARMDPPCNPAGLAFGPDGRLYLTGFGAAGDEIGVVSAERRNRRLRRSRPASPPARPARTASRSTSDGNLYVSDGGQAQGRVFRVGPFGRRRDRALPRPADGNAAGVGRREPLAPAGCTGRRAEHRRERARVRRGRRPVRRRHGARRAVEGRAGRRGAVHSSTGCDTTFPADTLCLDALFVQHPALDGADGIALDRDGNV